MNAHITQDTIRALQNADSDAALAQHQLTGETVIIDSLSDAQPLDAALVILRHPARAWADELVALARETAEAEGSSTHLAKLRATAATLAADELAEETARALAGTSAATYSVPAGHVLLTVEELATWRRLLDELEPLLLP